MGFEHVVIFLFPVVVLGRLIALFFVVCFSDIVRRRQIFKGLQHFVRIARLSSHFEGKNCTPLVQGLCFLSPPCLLSFEGLLFLFEILAALVQVHFLSSQLFPCCHNRCNVSGRVACGLASHLYVTSEPKVVSLRPDHRLRRRTQHQVGPSELEVGRPSAAPAISILSQPVEPAFVLLACSPARI